MESVPFLNANRHFRFQKCLPTEYSQSEGRIPNGGRNVNARVLCLICRKMRCRI